MSKEEEYELLPRTELDYMRKEVERLKRNPLGDTQASISLLDSIGKLNENIARLVQIFESANEEMSRAVQDAGVQEQLRKLRDENAKIAHGIVAVAELVKDVRAEQRASRAGDPPEPASEPVPASTAPSSGAQMDDAPLPPRSPLASPGSVPAQGPRTPPMMPGDMPASAMMGARQNPFMDPLSPFPEQPLPRTGRASAPGQWPGQGLGGDDVPPPPR